MRTPGHWKLGRTGTVVSDLVLFDDRSLQEAQYYGGRLLAESIANPDDAAMFVAAPRLAEACAVAVSVVSRIKNGDLIPDFELAMVRDQLLEAMASTMPERVEREIVTSAELSEYAPGLGDRK